jgi:hypothetical protein
MSKLIAGAMLAVAFGLVVYFTADSVSAGSCGGECHNGTIDHNANDTWFCNAAKECVTLSQIGADDTCPENWIQSGNCRGLESASDKKFQKYKYGWTSSSSTAGSLVKKANADGSFQYKIITGSAEAGWDFVKTTVDGKCDCADQADDGTTGNRNKCKACP